MSTSSLSTLGLPTPAASPLPTQSTPVASTPTPFRPAVTTPASPTPTLSTSSLSPPVWTPGTTLSHQTTGPDSNPGATPLAVQPRTPSAAQSSPLTPVRRPAPEQRPTASPEMPFPSTGHRESPLSRSSSSGEVAAAPPSAAASLPSPYDPRNETTPPHAFFAPALQQALRDGRSIAREAATAVARAQIAGDADLQRLQREAEALQNFRGSDTRTIAVLGDSGEGKSSLINSLLHAPGLAFTSDIGSACTSIATEYRQKRREQRAAFVVEVEYLSAGEIEEHIRELLWSYRRLYLPGVNASSTTEADYRTYERESEQAWSALEAAFRHKGSEFTPETAKDMSEGAQERLLRKLTEWASEIQWPRSPTGSGGVDGFWTATASTTQECVELTKKFMHDRYWPFTKIIRVFLSAQILKSGVVLTDLPGLHDTNLARVRVTQEYLLRCDHVLIVAKISRAITDQSLRSSLFMTLSRHVPTEWEEAGARRFNMAIVLTRTEDINLTAARAEFVGEGKRITPAVMDRLDDEIAAARQAGDRHRKKAAKRQQELLLVQARNHHVQEALRRTYAGETEGRALDVFCVSNKWYEKYGPKGNNRLVEASGIPSLRRFCQTIAADAQLAETLCFLRSRLSSLLNSLELWTANVLSQGGAGGSGQPFDCTAIYEKANSTRIEMLQLAANFRNSLAGCFDEQIMRYFAHRGRMWTEAAAAEGRQWMTWHHTQYNAWCGHDGEHRTANRNYVNWNAQIIWKMRTELEFQWDLLEEQAAAEFAATFNSASRILHSLKDKIREASGASPYTHALAESIDCKLGGLKYRLDCEQRGFLCELRARRRYTAEANCSSYILREMRPKYREAASQHGPGRMARQHKIVQGHIENDMLFHLLGSTLSAEMGQLMDGTQNALRLIIDEVFQGLMSDINMVFVNGSVPTQPIVRDEAATAGLREFAETVERLRERHEDVLETIEEL
ncbi:hypothetical protein VTK73DRAFT_7882 [Phialemonium thermophilum]|uniref:G domain-containing protein n=1 Tax=Phialemonium thermophilum TaxID=223376 RepID=A0ABR3XRC0_9PEZI